MVFVGIGAVYGITYLVVLVASLQPPAVYNKDFVQDYLLARAFSDPSHPDPYAPIRDLAERYLGVIGYGDKVHSTPHPPPVGLLLMPLTLVDYPTAATIWAGVQVASLIAAISLLTRAEAKTLRPVWVVSVGVVALGWHPVHLDLGLGQLMLVLLALLAGARLALLRGRPVLAGVLLGLAILLKVIAWPLLLLLALKRSWRATVAGLATILFGYILVGVVIGFETIAEYLLRIAPQLTAEFRYEASNQSLWTLGPRLLWIVAASEPTGLTAVLASLVPPALVLVAALAWARSRLELDPAFGVVLCASLLVSPIAWEVDLVLVAIPAVQLASVLMRRPSRGKLAVGAVIAILLLLERGDWLELGRLLAWVPGSALMSFGPALGVVVLGCSVALIAGRRMARGTAAG